MAKVYVSSTIADLGPERQATVEWLVARGHQPVHSYRPDGETVRESCLDDIDTCDLYVLILGHRYGFQPEENNPEQLSITHLEFRRAEEAGIPRIALLRTSVPDSKLSDLENPQRAHFVLAFRDEVRRQVRPAEFSDLRGLVQGLSTGIESELDRARAPAERQWGEVWLAAQLRDVSQQFASHMAASALRTGARPEALHLDLVVAEGHPGKREETRPEDAPIRSQRYPLEDVLRQVQGPLLLIGEGGSGKTTSLLYTAAKAADRARIDDTAPVPIFVNLAKLTVLNDVPDLLQLIADSVPLVKDWDELSEFRIPDRRPYLFLFDSFDEMPERLQSNATVIIRRFVEKQKDHACLIGSRPVPHIEQLARPPSQFRVFEILRLTPDQVRGFLADLGLGSLYDRMPTELRDLAGNPFMLLAIARTLAGESEGALPRNRGKLYERFARGWIANEERKRRRSLEYSYERVKEPLLAYLAKRMTSAGQTSLAWAEDIEHEVETQLAAIHERIKRRGGMPDDWTVDRCLDETLGDGLLKRANGQLHFMHQSLQEYFTGVYFRHTAHDVLVEFTPRLSWESVSTYALAEVPNHRFVSALLMMTGLLDDGTKIVESLAPRNPVLAAAAISSASRVDGSLLASLEQSWLDLLEHDDLSHRVVGCSCVALSATRSPRIIKRLVAFALGADFNNSNVGIPALGRLGAPDAIVLELAERACNLADGEYRAQRHEIGRLVRELHSAHVVKMLFDLWRASAPGSSSRHRFEGLLASVDTPLRDEELQRIRSGAPDPETTADAERALAEAASWEPSGGMISATMIWSRLERERKQFADQFADQLAEMLAIMRNNEDREIAAGLRSGDAVVRVAAATLAAERELPVGDAIVESILRFGHDWRGNVLVSALVSQCGEQTAVSKLVERSREGCYRIATLPAELTAQLAYGELPGAVKVELKRLGVRDDLFIEKTETEGDTSTWDLRPSSWGDFRPRYQLRASAGSLEFYDCNAASRAFAALAAISGEASVAELWRAVELDDSQIQRIAVDVLAERGDPRLASRLLAKLRSSTSAVFIDTALSALGRLGAREAVSLVEDLLLTSDGEFSDVHPVWGPCHHSSGWAHDIHRTLVRLKADSDIQQTLDRALASDDPVSKVAALKEFSRWFAESDPKQERGRTWRTPARMQRLADLALRDSSESIRTAASGALANLKCDVVQRSLADALADHAAAVQVAAGEALIRIEARELYGRIAEAMMQVTKSGQPQEFRQRAGKVLSAIPGGVEPFYRPIQEELNRGGSNRVLDMIEATLEVLPGDANLFWWRGHALRSLGRLDQAADSFQRAGELEEGASIIPQALAQTFLELGDFPRAMEIARRGVEIDPRSADAASILAWSCYKAGAIPEAIEAARRAVDLDPVHGDAIWIVLLAEIRQANPEEARSAFEHARRVRQLLSPGLDTSFLPSFLKELESIDTGEAEISRLIDDIKEALR
jgi:tetratricopeptide (TPR) repeat protein